MQSWAVRLTWFDCNKLSGILLFTHVQFKDNTDRGEAGLHPNYCSSSESLVDSLYIYVAVKFLSQVIFIFLLFLGMVMYANEVETKEK